MSLVDTWTRIDNYIASVDSGLNNYIFVSAGKNEALRPQGSGPWMTTFVEISHDENISFGSNPNCATEEGTITIEINDRVGVGNSNLYSLAKVYDDIRTAFMGTTDAKILKATGSEKGDIYFSSMTQTAAYVVNDPRNRHNWMQQRVFIAYRKDFNTVNAPVNTAVPTVTGTSEVGEVLTTDNGTWTNSPTSYTYRWLRDDVAISGATSSTYTLVLADNGTTIKSEVTAINADGSSLPAESVGTSIIQLVVAHYDFTDSSKLISGATSTDVEGWKDSTVNGYDLSQPTASAQPTFTQPNGPIVFDGSDFFEGLPSPDVNFTWVFKVKATASTSHILAGSESLDASPLPGIWMDTTLDSLHFRTLFGVINSVSVDEPLLNNNVTVALVKAGTLYTFYLNGLPVGSPIVDSGSITSLTILGGWLNVGAARFSGEMDKLSIYNRDLSDSEIANITAELNS